MSQDRVSTRGVAAIGILLVAAFAFKMAVIAAGQKYLRSDEAVVGLMAKHVITRGERPLFLYGQSYGGGHAITAYIAAPLFALFGRSGALLTAIPAALSVGAIWLVWRIVRTHISKEAALPAAALYAFSPPVAYQSFLVNGGTETFLLALAGLWFFLNAYSRPLGKSWTELTAGIFAGLAYWGMDYALLYAVVFGLLFATARRWKSVALLGCGFLVGCAPLLVFNVQNDFQHLRYMFSGPPGSTRGVKPHFLSAMAGLLRGDLASFFAGDIDDMLPAGPGAWAHGFLAMLAIAVLAWKYRKALGQIAPTGRKRELDWITVSRFLPVVFIVVYLLMYGMARFSMAGHRTPRYLLPLCPFLSIAIALIATSFSRSWMKQTALAVTAGLLIHGAVVSWQVNARTWHFEHRIQTSGSDMRELGKALKAAGVRAAYAPYEIQWRLMFETDEAVLVSCRNISAIERYPDYERAVERALTEGEPVAFAFRKDFAFAEMASREGVGLVNRDRFAAACRTAGIAEEGHPAGAEFCYYYPLDLRFMGGLKAAVESSATPGK